MQRYECLDHIRLTTLFGSITHINIEEVYLYDSRQIRVRGKAAEESLNLTDQIFPVQTSERVVWGGIRSLAESAVSYKKPKQEAFAALIISAIQDESRSSLLRELVELNVSRSLLTVPSLRTILTRCPNLKLLRCSLNDGPTSFRDEFRDLMKGPGAGLMELDVRGYFGDALRLLRCLEGCPSLKIKGAILMGSTMQAVVPPCAPPDGDQIRTNHLNLAPSLCTSWKQYIPDPYRVARQLRYYTSPSCLITIDLAGKEGEELIWLRILASILQSLQWEEDLRRAETKSWAKCDPPPQPN